MMYKRTILSELEKHLRVKEVIVLTGMRRVGKTTLLKHLYDSVDSDNKALFDVENPIVRSYFEETDYDNVWENLKQAGLDETKKAYIFLDEIQAMPEITHVIKYLYDHYDVKFVVTGSSSYYLKNLFPESLAGRKYVFELFPLSFEEFLTFKGVKKSYYRTILQIAKYKNKIQYEQIKNHYAEYLKWGGFPEVVLERDEELKKMKLEDIFKAYFEKDVKGLADFSNLSRFRDLMLLLIQRIGSKLDVTKLASEIGVTRTTVYSYISFLESTYYLYRISPFSKNVDREVSGAEKIYVCDTGFINLFGKVDAGSVLENAVFLNLRKYGKLQYYSRRKGGEIDFILGENISLEVKSKAVPQHIKEAKRTSKIIGIKNCFVVSNKFVDEHNIVLAQDL